MPSFLLYNKSGLLRFSASSDSAAYARIFIIAVIRDPGVFYEFPLQQIEALDLLCYILYKNFVITQYIKAWGT